MLKVSDDFHMAQLAIPNFIESPEGVKWELGFGHIFTGKVGFGSLGLGFGHWEWESQTEKQ